MIQTHAVKPWHVIGVATLLGFFSGIQSYQFAALFETGKRQPFWVPLGMNLGYWYAWAVLVPLVVWLARRFPLERGRIARSLPAHLAFALVVTFCHVAICEAVSTVIIRAAWADEMAKSVTWWGRTKRIWLMNFDWETVGYIAIVGLATAVRFYRQAQERTLRASQLETRLAEAQLQALQRQLHPHFLFNTLHAISALMHRDVNAADEMLTRLSDLLRMALDQRGVQEIPLKDELDFLAKYLEIEQARFGDRLTVVFDIDPVTLDAQVPNLLLQPLVENSVRHAVAVRIEPGRIEIRSRRNGDRLELAVIDNGPGLPKGQTIAGKGLGLANTRSRLEHLYGATQQLTFAEPPGGGLAAVVSIPFHAEEPAEVFDEATDAIKGVA